MVKQPRLTVNPLPPPGRKLNDYTWAEIRQIADAGKGPEYFKVGDTKAVHIQGTVGTLAVNDTFYVYILGFDHNMANDSSAKNTIDFGCFKSASTGGKGICLVDGNSYKSDGSKWFNMNHSGNTNAGGWKSCDLRYDILGSVNAKGQQDASSTTATDPVPNTLLAALPSDLRAVMAPMTIYTDNHGESSNTAENVTSTVDYLPLLAEFEIFGKCTYANTYEQNHQAQYDYFKKIATSYNSRTYYRHSNIDYSEEWWERSPYYSNGVYFCRVYSSGQANGNSANTSEGLSPIFRV